MALEDVACSRAVMSLRIISNEMPESGSGDTSDLALVVSCRVLLKPNLLWSAGSHLHVMKRSVRYGPSSVWVLGWKGVRRRGVLGWKRLDQYRALSIYQVVYEGP